MEKKLRVCDIVYFHAILSQSPITSVEITLREFLQQARQWRRKHDARFLMPNIACDNYTAELVSKVNAIPHIEPDLTMDETIALLTLLYEQRVALGTVWSDFCNLMKNASINFHIAVCYVVKWANLVLPTQPPKTEHLDRLLDELFVHDAMQEFYVKCTGEVPPSNIYQFNVALRNLLPWHRVEIFPTGLLCNHLNYETISFPTGWTEDLTQVLKNVKKTAQVN